MNLMRKFNDIKSYILSSGDRFLAFIDELYHHQDLKIIDELFLDKDVQNKIKILNISFPITHLSINVLNIILKDNYFKEKFLSLKIDDINRLVLKGLIIPFFYINDDLFINKYLDVINIEQRRFYVNNLIKNNYSIYEILNKIIYGLDDKEIKRYADLIDLNDKKIDVSILSKRIFELLIDKYFRDFSYNIMINITMMLKFHSKLKEKCIDEERLYWYKALLKFDKYSGKKQIKIYENIPSDIDVWLYEDFRTCQNFAYNLINESITDFTKIKTCIKEDVIIYELTGEDFILPVHATGFNKNGNEFVWKEDFKTLSISLIGSNCLGLYRNPKEVILVGFKKLNINDIMHMYHADSYSEGVNSSNKINELYTPLELLSITYEYNEILVAQNILNNQKLKPDYLVCYDVITDFEFVLAHKLNIPIVLIMTRCYKESNYSDFDSFDGSYITNLEDLCIKNFKKF